jgi:hypothetical protein
MEEEYGLDRQIALEVGIICAYEGDDHRKRYEQCHHHQDNSQFVVWIQPDHGNDLRQRWNAFSGFQPFRE